MKELDITITEQFYEYLLKKYNFTSKDEITNEILLNELKLNCKSIRKERINE